VTDYQSAPVLPQPDMPFKATEAGEQSPRGVLRSRLLFELLSASVLGLRGRDRANEQDREAV
jgi:hypothetical protein